MEYKLMFILLYLRKAISQDIFGEVYEMPQTVANKWFHIFRPCSNHVQEVRWALEKSRFSSKVVLNGACDGRCQTISDC
jgi:hypothetical protein